jgi:hypothetical protein
VVNGLTNDAETFTTGTAYLTDVNSDGLPDLVNGGAVLFNHLEYSAALPQCANVEHYIVGRPTKIVVTSAGATPRHRESTIDCTTGNLLQVRQFIDGANFAQTDLTCFPNGTMQRFTGPPNKNGQRAFITYQYDPVTQTHPIQIVDHFGLLSSATYNHPAAVIPNS